MGFFNIWIFLWKVVQEEKTTENSFVFSEWALKIPLDKSFGFWSFDSLCTIFLNNGSFCIWPYWCSINIYSFNINPALEWKFHLHLSSRFHLCPNPEEQGSSTAYSHSQLSEQLVPHLALSPQSNPSEEGRWRKQAVFPTKNLEVLLHAKRKQKSFQNLCCSVR